jgi:hypothetical protein
MHQEGVEIQQEEIQELLGRRDLAGRQSQVHDGPGR